MATSKNILKNWFKNGKKPNQEQFWAWMDSYWHKDEKLSIEAIEGLDEILGDKADSEQLEALANSNASNLTQSDIEAWITILGIEELPDNLGLVDDDNANKVGNVYLKDQVNALLAAIESDLADQGLAIGSLNQNLSDFKDEVFEELDEKVDKEPNKGLSQENFTSSEKQKLAQLESSKYRGSYNSLQDIINEYPEGENENWHDGKGGWYADVDKVGEDPVRYIWDYNDYKWVLGSVSPLTGEQIKQMYEEQPDTNVFDDDAKNRLAGLDSSKYEKIENKTDEVEDDENPSTTKYLSVKGVVDWVKSKLLDFVNWDDIVISMDDYDNIDDNHFPTAKAVKRMEGEAEDSVEIGKNAKAEGKQSIALGRDASAKKDRDVAIGHMAKAEGQYVNNATSVAIGYFSEANKGTAIGHKAKAIGFKSIALNEGLSSANYSVAFGYSSQATGENSIAFGRESQAPGENSIAFGRESQAPGENSMAFGRESQAPGENSIAFGYQSKATKSNQIMLGTENEEVAMPNSATVENVPLQDNAVVNRKSMSDFVMRGVYGIRYDKTAAAPEVERIGDMEMHKAVNLPVHNTMRGCILKDNREVAYYLKSNDWAKKEDGNDSKLDGTDGQVMVEFGGFWIRYREDGNYQEVLVSMTPFLNAKYVPKQYIGAYEAAIDRSANKLSSVMNSADNYRGGNDNSSWDNEEISLLGLPASNYSLNDAISYASNRGDYWKAGWYEQIKIINWLITIEYATRDHQAGYTTDLTPEGYRKGGLGEGATTVVSSDWTAYNSQYPVIPCGYTNSLGNNTGNKILTIADFNGHSEDIEAVRYRGIENYFGHIWKWTDGIIRDSEKVYAATGAEWNINDMNGRFIGNTPISSGYISEIIFGNEGDIIPKSATGGSSSTYFSDYMWSNDGTPRAFRFGGRLSSGRQSGPAAVATPTAPTDSHSDSGARLCVIPKKEN